MWCERLFGVCGSCVQVHVCVCFLKTFKTSNSSPKSESELEYPHNSLSDLALGAGKGARRALQRSMKPRKHINVMVASPQAVLWKAFPARSKRRVELNSRMTSSAMNKPCNAIASAPCNSLAFQHTQAQYRPLGVMMGLQSVALCASAWLVLMMIERLSGKRMPLKSRSELSRKGRRT